MDPSARQAPPRLSRFAWPALAVVVLLQALGLALSAHKDGTAVGTWLFLVQLFPEPASIRYEWLGTAVAGLGSLAAVFARRPLLRIGGAAVASAWCAALALAEWRMGGAPFTGLALPAHATRIAAPLALAFWHRRAGTAWLLRFAVAITFGIHGFEALGLHPQFVDFLLAADAKVFGLGLTQQGAELLLRIIGAHDVALAVLVLTTRDLRPLLAWMAAWGVITALSRVVIGGQNGLHHAVIRSANGGLPLVLLLATGRSFMQTKSLSHGRLARAALPLLLVAAPLAVNAQALTGNAPGHLRLVWTEDPAHRTTFSWSTTSEGGTHEVHLDTQPRGGSVGAYARTVAAQSSGAYATGGAAYHHATVDGLEPSTTYWFVVVSDGQASPERHFVTAPVDDRPFRILSGGDSRAPGEAERRTMNGIIAQLAGEDESIIALAHGGDYIQSDGAWDEWDSWMADHGGTFTAGGRVLPIIPVRGNHEGDGAMYNEVFGFPGGTGEGLDYFTTQLGANVRLINLDTNSSIGGDQAAWLDQELAAAQAGRWILASYHRPAFPAVKTPSAALQFWVPLFEQHDVDVVLESDGHVLKRTVPIRNGQQDPTGVVYVGEGGLGVPQREPNDEWYLQAPGMAASAHHVQRFSFSPEALVYEAIGIDGTVADTYTFQPRRAGTPVEPPAEAPALASVEARSASEVAVTFSVDMDAATAAATWTLAPEGTVESAVQDGARTFVLRTSPLVAGADYVLTVTGATAASGAAAGPLSGTFRVPEAGEEPGGGGTPSLPGTPDDPTAPDGPGTDKPGTAEPPGGGEVPGGVDGPGDGGAPAGEIPTIGGGSRSSSSGSGCSAAGGAFAWAGLGGLAALLRRRRR